MTKLTDAERLRISAVVHQNYYMPEVFAAVEAILAEREASLRGQIALDIEADPVCHPQDAGAVCPGCQAERIARGGDGA